MYIWTPLKKIHGFNFFLFFSINLILELDTVWSCLVQFISETKRKGKSVHTLPKALNKFCEKLDAKKFCMPSKICGILKFGPVSKIKWTISSLAFK